MCRHTFQALSDRYDPAAREQKHYCSNCSLVVLVTPVRYNPTPTFSVLVQTTKAEREILAARPLTLKLTPEAKRSDTFKASKLDKVLDKAGKYSIRAVA